MKKYFLTFIFMFFMFFGIAKAENIFGLDWETEKQTSTVSYYTNYYYTGSVTYEFSYLLYTNYQDYKDGYITSEEIFDSSDSSWKTLVTIYDKNGNILKQNYDYNFTIDDLLVINDVIYVLAYDSNATSNQYSVKILDEDLKVSKSAILEYYTKNWDAYIRKYYGVDFISYDGTSLIIYNGYNGYIIDLDLSLETYTRSSSFNPLKQEYVRYNILRQVFGNYKGGITGYVSSNIVSDNETIMSGAYFDEECTQFDETKPCCVTSYIISSFDNNNNMLWSLENNDYLGITDVSYVDDYIIGLANKYDENGNVINLILILDKEGNVVQEIVKDDNIMMLRPTDNGFMVLTYADKNDEDLTNYSVEVYTYVYDIKTKVNGEGKIETDSYSKAGKDITFVITPDEGYLLSNVKVTDSDGKVVEFKENKFTMPSTDVIIEATFVKEEKNPNTSSSAIPTIMAFSSLICVVVIVLASRRKEMLE